MNNKLQSIDKRRNYRRKASTNDLHATLSSKIIGQADAVDAIVPFVQMHQAELSPEGRPLGVFLFLGPTGTGKTRTVEALAESLHGSAKSLLRIDCGEYQLDHEVAKLIGAPPGYLGHRETHPVLTQARLASVASENCNISIVLFDEIEKAAPSMNRLLLGILDKASLRLGDNNVVNFEKTLIFMTSNLGARNMMKELNTSFGFQSEKTIEQEASTAKRMSSIAVQAAKRTFAPEFMNRVDSIVTYQPLDTQTLRLILDQQIEALQDHIDRKLAGRAFRLQISEQSRQFLLSRGTSTEFGAREIRRTLHRFVTQPLAALVSEGKVKSGASVQTSPRGDDLILRVAA